jgi:hypothetical protein
VNHFTDAISLSTRPGGTTVNLVLTSHFYPACRWNDATDFQFLSKSGAPIGPVVRAPTISTVVVPSPLLRNTFVALESVTTEEGVRCTAEKATSLEVTSPKGTSLQVDLPEQVSVCVSGTTHWTKVSAPTFPVAARCPSSALRFSFGQGQGTAGTTFIALIVTNSSAQACTVAGTPTVQPTTGLSAGVAHSLVGPHSRIVPQSGSGRAIRLAPGARASANLGLVDAGNYTSSTCRPKEATSIAIGFEGAQGWLAFKGSVSVCTKLASTTISGIVPNVRGLSPQ